METKQVVGEELPLLYGKDARGNIRVWQVTVEGDAYIVKSGVLNGKMTTHKRRCSPKNIGRSNETTAQEQAQREATSKHTDQMRKKEYSATLPSLIAPAAATTGPAKEMYSAMLAERFEKVQNKIKFPLFVQPKLDGCRNLVFVNASGRIMSQTRQHKPQVGDLVEIEAECKLLLQALPPGACLDGELYKHGLGFQAIISLVKRASKKPKLETKSQQLEYHIYDWQDLACALPFQKRFQLLQEAFRTAPGIQKLKLVPTAVANTVQDAEKQFSEYLSAGYEGAMLRTFQGPYEPKKRSKHLVKRKQFEDEEFKIIDVVEGKGSKEGCAIWRVQDLKQPSIEFQVLSKGTDEERHQMWRDRQEYMGKLLTVKFQGRSEDGVPRFGVGIAVRDYE